MEIIPATIQHIIDIDENITLEDMKEFIMYKKYVLKNEKSSLMEHLLEACSNYDVYTMIHGDIVYAVGGELNGCVWFLTSRYLSESNKDIKRMFIQVMNEHKERVLDETGFIWNFIWEGNKTHISFLKMMGAEFPEETEDVPERFKLFIIRR
ncbi:phage protein Gp13 family protein [Enterobacter roggenkampii]|uniref:phage protein Gp13 family protein n=1 Tax=Enterobacter roggenkampii TaxID=1812935 RepID=UPI0035D427C2